jgi:hypothetical protein
MSYLEDYGAAEAQKERRGRQIRRALLVLLGLAVVAGSLYLWFKNYRQEQRVEGFLALLQKGDYPTAYTFWGCKVAAPCPNYDYKSFLEDWGPSSPIGKVNSFRLGRSRETGSGVVVEVRINQGAKPVRIWVEKSNGVLGFAPLLL